jgi:23S rRNA pseudouridine2605 synthase
MPLANLEVRVFSLTAEQLEASRAERMRLNGHGALTLEDARTWIEETGLCLFLPRRQYSAGLAPSFVEAIAGGRNSTPGQKHISLAEELLVRLEVDGIAVRLNLLGQPGEQPDFVVAAWVLPYVYALRGDRDWRRTPQLTGSRQVSQLAIMAYKQLEVADATIPQLKHALGKEVTEGAVLRAITELWQQLRIIPAIAAPGQHAKWQLLRHRFQKAIAEGASTSQVTAISVLASIYLQAVIAASMEDVELFLAPLTARSKIREVLRGLVATRQVHTISLGHAPHFYVAGTLPEFTVAPNTYASSAMASSYYFDSSRFEGETPFVPERRPEPIHVRPEPIRASTPAPVPEKPAKEAPPVAAAHKAASNGKPAQARPHFSRPAAHARDRKRTQSSSNRLARRPSRDSRTSSNRTSTSRPGNSRVSPGSRWAKTSSNGNRASTLNGNHSSRNGNGLHNGHASNGNGKATPQSRVKRSVHSTNGKIVGKTGMSARGSASARGNVSRKDVRVDARSRKPALTAGAKAGNSKRYGFTAPAKQRTKKRG